MWCALGISFFRALFASFHTRSSLSSYLLRLFLCLISFLLFPCASVWESTRARVPMSYSHTEWYLPFFARRNSLFGPKLRLQNIIKLTKLLMTRVVMSGNTVHLFWWLLSWAGMPCSCFDDACCCERQCRAVVLMMRAVISGNTVQLFWWRVLLWAACYYQREYGAVSMLSRSRRPRVVWSQGTELPSAASLQRGSSFRGVRVGAETMGEGEISKGASNTNAGTWKHTKEVSSVLRNLNCSARQVRAKQQQQNNLNIVSRWHKRSVKLVGKFNNFFKWYLYSTDFCL